jgi:hypothetical protein
MAVRPSTPEIITVNSEALQTQIRDLLPSQNGFGSELQASNVITPIIDLTATAEGSGLRSDLQTAIAFGSQTAFNIVGATTTLANAPGFYRLTGVINLFPSSGTSSALDIDMSDGGSTKSVYKTSSSSTSTVVRQNFDFDKVFWLDTGVTLSCTTSSTAQFAGSIRQIADSAGATVNPSGYPL